MIVMGRRMVADPIFFRIVKTAPPTVTDFLSNRALGRPRRRNESEEVWTGLSHYDTAERARNTARRFPALGAFIAALHVPPDGPFRVARTFGPGHYTVWGDPRDFLAAVLAVVPVEPAPPD